MKRRGFFGTIGAAVVGAKVAQAAIEAAAATKPLADVRVVDGAEIRTVEFTQKQQEVIDAMDRNHPAIVVLFSGHRGCGRTFVCQYLMQCSPRTLVVTPSAYSAKIFEKMGAPSLPKSTIVLADGNLKDRLRGYRYDRVIVDDAHLMEAEDIRFVAGRCRSPYGGEKVLLTGMPYGPGAPLLHDMFPAEGMNKWCWYHVHAKPWSNPHLAEYGRLLDGQPIEKRERLINGDWS